MNLSLKHDAAFCLVDHCPICEGATEKASASTASCTFCGESGITYPHTCYPVSDINKIPDMTNRFDPFEALDTILERAEDIEEQNHETPDVMACIGRLADIRGEVNALRAYITGMER